MDGSHCWMPFLLRWNTFWPNLTRRDWWWLSTLCFSFSLSWNSNGRMGLQSSLWLQKNQQRWKKKCANRSMPSNSRSWAHRVFSLLDSLAAGASTMNLLKFPGSQIRENPFYFMTPKITLQNVLHCQFSSLHGFLQGKGLTVITILTLLLREETPRFK